MNIYDFQLDPALIPWTEHSMMLPPIPTFTDNLVSGFEISKADGFDMAIDRYSTGEYDTSLGQVFATDVDNMASGLFTTGKGLNGCKSRASRVPNEQQDFLHI